MNQQTSKKNSEVINTLFATKNSTGVNRILGGEGNDTVSGDTNDRVDGGPGIDTAILAVATSDPSVDAARMNALAALYIACGQDPACVAESAVGVTRMELNQQGNLYVSVTLPSIMTGTVGGGTSLPTQRACLEILGMAGPGHAQGLAEVCGALALAGEISLTSAICSNDFARAHQQLARGRRSGEQAENG